MPSISDLNFRNAQKLQAGDAGSLFGELTVAERTPIIELNSSYGLSVVRDVQVSANGGTAAAVDSGEILLKSNATANGFMIVRSAENGRYMPGYGAQIGVGIRMPVAPTGNQYATWGGQDFDDTEAFYFGVDADGIYVARLKDSVEQNKIYQSGWNIDRLNGLGVSGATLDLTNGNIFQIDFSWYGYGLIVFGVALASLTGTQRIFPCHSIRVTGSTSVRSPNLHVYADTYNGGDESNLDLYLGGRQYSVVGKYEPSYRFCSQYRAAISTSTARKPLITFRGKAGFLDRAIMLDAIDLLPASEDVIAEMVLDGTLTGASYGTPTNYTAAETACEVDVAATAISGGTTLWGDYFASGAANKESLSDAAVDFVIPEDQPISLCVRTPSGTGTCAGFFRMREEW